MIILTTETLRLYSSPTKIARSLTLEVSFSRTDTCSIQHTNEKRIAYQRTYDGAYTRASIAILIFSLLITKLFSKSFIPIGLVYTIYGSLIFIISIHRSTVVNNFILGDGNRLYYKTAGNIVALIGFVSLSSYIVLLVLILRLE